MFIYPDQARYRSMVVRDAAPMDLTGIAYITHKHLAVRKMEGIRITYANKKRWSQHASNYT